LWEQVNEITEFLKWNEETSGHAVSAYYRGKMTEAAVERGVQYCGVE
jgi:hypothetical protein